MKDNQYFLVSMEREDSYLSPSTKIIKIRALQRKSREGMVTTPLWQTCYKKWLRQTRVKLTFSDQCKSLQEWPCVSFLQTRAKQCVQITMPKWVVRDFFLDDHLKETHKLQKSIYFIELLHLFAPQLSFIIIIVKIFCPNIIILHTIILYSKQMPLLFQPVFLLNSCHSYHSLLQNVIVSKTQPFGIMIS